jgi:hypothetical protein
MAILSYQRGPHILEGFFIDKSQEVIYEIRVAGLTGASTRLRGRGIIFMKWKLEHLIFINHSLAPQPVMRLDARFEHGTKANSFGGFDQRQFYRQQNQHLLFSPLHAFDRGELDSQVSDAGEQRETGIR